MDQLVQCPVCTLFLHNGMSLESHLDTHPKDQVIKALCSLSKNSNYGSRTPTPVHSERSFRSGSRTPATEDSSARWTGSRSGDPDRYWRRTPSRTPKTVNPSRGTTPSYNVRMPDINFESNSVSQSAQYSDTPYSLKLEKLHAPYMQNPPLAEFDQQYIYYQDQQDDREIKYSRSAEYSAIDGASNVFTYNMPPVESGVKLQTTLVPNMSRRNSDLIKIMPKPNNILVKANMGGMQYLAPAVKPVHVVMPPTQTYVQKNVQNNMIVTGPIPSTSMLGTKAVTPLTPNFSMTSSTFTPGTTVVTQNSQIIYREMVHNLEGKPFLSNIPVLSGHENVTNVAQTSSVYQNVMVVDQFGNTSCMYATPSQLIPKSAAATSMYNNVSQSSAQTDKTVPNMTNEFNKNLVIEVGPIVSSGESSGTLTPKIENATKTEKPDKPELRNETPVPTRGLKILSNIKVEVPVQHHKNMLNTILDLTGPNEECQQRPISPDKILPDIKMRPTTSSEVASNSTDNAVSFSVIKNIGNPPSYKEAMKSVENKIETEFSDSNPVPDLICNEKPSISPCSELSEHGDNFTDRPLISPKPETSVAPVVPNIDTTEKKTRQSVRANNLLRLNNIFVKKNKKVLQIKNAKTFTTTSSCIPEPTPSSSTCKSPENFSMTKLNQDKEKIGTLHTISVEKIDERDDQEFVANLHTISVEKIDERDDQEYDANLRTISVEKIDDRDDQEFDANTEEQSMDIEPIAPSTMNSNQYAPSVDIVQVKEEINTSNEDGFSYEAGSSDRHLTQLETLRPINVITYGNMTAGDFDDESNHRELLDLEASSKNKQFVNMMSENYFGDNIYADYFTPNRVESFDDRDSGLAKESGKDGMYLWGEPSQRESEFVLPNFIHESYKIAESSGYDMGEGNMEVERDSKADVLSEGREEPLNICADERMPSRGELSGESNGDMDASWSGMYNEVAPSEPYDLIARESWVSDGSEADPTDKRDALEEELSFPKSRGHSCGQCGARFPLLRELRAHRAVEHAAASSSAAKGCYGRLGSGPGIKQEGADEASPIIPVSATMLSLESKEAIAKSMLQVYGTLADSAADAADAKPKVEGIKQEPKRRRKDYVCATCKVDQESEAAFHAHLRTHPLECLTCGKCFYRRNNLALHLKGHLGIKNYKCEVCEKRFITRQKLNEHHNIHTGRAPVKCTHCDDTFRRYSNMVQHRDRHHFNKKTKVRDFICHCGAIFHSRAKLLWHKETHDDKPKACLYCSDKFVHSSSLTRHVRRAHNALYLPPAPAPAPAVSTLKLTLSRTQAPPPTAQPKARHENVPCPVCKQVYLRSNLRAHLATHSGKRPYVCIICNKAFTTKWNLKLHRWTHMSRSHKPFKCHLCKGAFIRQTEYISHMNAHKSVRPYTCNYCGCQFIRKYNCQRHVREHEMTKKYVCKVPECGKSFHRSYYLSEHMKVHSGARPFSCHICGKTSSNKSNHNKHVKIHHAREPIATEA